jgi:hypothetical protein
MGIVHSGDAAFRYILAREERSGKPALSQPRIEMELRTSPVTRFIDLLPPARLEALEGRRISANV